MRTPQGSEGDTTVEINAKLHGEQPLLTIEFVICVEHWLGPSLELILIRGNTAGTPLPLKTRAFFVDWR